MPYKNKITGEVISDQEAIQRGIQQPVQQSQPLDAAQKPKINFLERLKLGFGGAEAKAKQQQLETDAGLKGKLDIGDIADVAGASLPIIGSMLGGTAGARVAGPGGVLPGVAIGAGAGQGLRRGIGAMIGADQPNVGEVAKDVVYTGIGTYVGGKILSGVFNAVAKVIPSKLMSTIFKQSADDIKLEVITGGKNLTQATEVLNEGFRGDARTMMVKSLDTMKNLEQQAQRTVAGKPVLIDNKKGYIDLIKDYVNNLKKTSFGFESKIADEGTKIMTQLQTVKGDIIPGELALAARRFIDGVRRTSSFKLNPILAPKEAAYKKSANALRSALAKQISGISNIMNRYSIHINAFEDLAKFVTKSQNKDLFDLIDVFIMYGIDPIAYLARRGLTSAALKTNVAQGLYQGGKLLENFLPKGIVPSTATRGIMDIFKNQSNQNNSYQ